ncbi:MAG: LD-carboxypeptidase [Acidobacteria bacterium]|nr:LD-carboxypeptidase [Acidobacteriota bacterium]
MSAARLAPGGPIAVVATAGPVTPALLESGLSVLRGWGHAAAAGPSIRRRRGFLAGPDECRSADLDAAIHRRDRPAIFFASGGWGTARLLDAIDLRALRARPRVLLGYSDLTSLFMALQTAKRPYPYRYGPSVSELGDPGAFHAPSLREALYLPEPSIAHSLRGVRTLRPGRAAGRLIGGCLTLLNHLLGTAHDSSWDGCILFWEDLNEPPYRIDRMLQQLRLAGKLARLAGMVVGTLRGCKAVPPTAGWPMSKIILEATAGTRYPIVTGFPTGHIPRKRTLLMGVPAELDTQRSRLLIRSGG